MLIIIYIPLIIRYLWLLTNGLSFTGIDDDDSAVDDLIHPAEEDMPVLEGDDDTSRMEEVD